MVCVELIVSQRGKSLIDLVDKSLILFDLLAQIEGSFVVGNLDEKRLFLR